MAATLQPAATVPTLTPVEQALVRALVAALLADIRRDADHAGGRSAA